MCHTLVVFALVLFHIFCAVYYILPTDLRDAPRPWLSRARYAKCKPQYIQHKSQTDTPCSIMQQQKQRFQRALRSALSLCGASCLMYDM